MEKMSERHCGIWTIAHLAPDDAVQIISGDCKFIWAFPPEHKANVHRLVTCANFCAGLSNEELLSPATKACDLHNIALERGREIGKLRVEFAKASAELRAENERLMADLESIITASGQSGKNLGAKGVIDGIQHMRLIVDCNRIDTDKYNQACDERDAAKAEAEKWRDNAAGANRSRNIRETE